MGADCRLHRRCGDPLRFRREGKLELTTGPRSTTVAMGIPEGRTARGMTSAKFVRAAEMVRRPDFHSLRPRRVAPGGEEAGGSRLLMALGNL